MTVKGVMVEIHFLFCYLERGGDKNGFFLWNLCRDWCFKKTLGMDFLMTLINIKSRNLSIY